jgi:hypothetical protein
MIAPAEIVFDKLRKLITGATDPDVKPGSRPRPQAGKPRRPAQPRSLRSKSLGAGLSSGAAGAGPGTDSRPETPPPEVACPNCGEPMLTGWGTTCGKCRPNLVAPKTLFMSRDDLALSQRTTVGMTLGWLVVSRSLDSVQSGALIELDNPLVVLSRSGAMPGDAGRVVPFEDSFMSNGHALLRRPATGEPTDAFTIADRQDPGPSANGTFVNAHKLAGGEVVRLSDGDTIKVGATELLFKALWLPPPSSRSS